MYPYVNDISILLSHPDSITVYQNLQVHLNNTTYFKMVKQAFNFGSTYNNLFGINN